MWNMIIFNHKGTQTCLVGRVHHKSNTKEFIFLTFVLLCGILNVPLWLIEDSTKYYFR
jgi:hypothetical protein